MTDNEAHRPTAFDRIMKPESGVPYYHYCNSSTFLAILEGGGLRFSDANMMNLCCIAQPVAAVPTAPLHSSSCFCT